MTPAPHVLIIVVTAGRDPAALAAQAEAGGFLAKLFDIDDLLGLVARYARLT